MPAFSTWGAAILPEVAVSENWLSCSVAPGYCREHIRAVSEALATKGWEETQNSVRSISRYGVFEPRPRSEGVPYALPYTGVWQPKLTTSGSEWQPITTRGLLPAVPNGLKTTWPLPSVKQPSG